MQSNLKYQKRLRWISNFCGFFLDFRCVWNEFHVKYTYTWTAWFDLCANFSNLYKSDLEFNFHNNIHLVIIINSILQKSFLPKIIYFKRNSTKIVQIFFHLVWDLHVKWFHNLTIKRLQFGSFTAKVGNLCLIFVSFSLLNNQFVNWIFSSPCSEQLDEQYFFMNP